MVSQRDSWLALTVEEPLEPGLPICDPHHHFWDREGDRYLLDQLTQDLVGGHNVAQTVFIECHSMYRARGPEELRSVGEVEADEGLAGEAEDTGKLESGAAAVARHGAESHLPEAQRRLRRQLPARPSRGG